MSTDNEYMLLFRGTNWDKDLSPEQLQKVVADWYAWFDGLRQQGKVTSGHPLKNEGKLVSGNNGRTVIDGPFSESKETIGGYFYLTVADMDEAVRIAQRCPGLQYGAVVEVRPVAEQCSVKDRAMKMVAETEQLAAATA